MSTTVMPASPPGLRIRLLGDFSISAGAHTVTETGWRLRKAKSLIKLLALAPGRRLHREQVMAALWPDLAPAAAANNFYQALHAARRMLEPAGQDGQGCLQLRNEIVAFCPDGPVWSDVEEFEQAAAGARRNRDSAAYRAAIGLYAGDLLPADRYEEWAVPRRETLRQQHLELLTESARLDEEHGNVASAINTLQQVVAHDAVHEPAHRDLMRLYAQTGNRTRALRQYRILSDTLRSELGVEPDPDTRRVYDDIAQGRIASTGGAAPSTSIEPSDLPAATSALSAHGRAVLRRLAVFAGGFSGPAAEAVCADGITAGEVATALSQLVDRGLLVAHLEAGDTRYRVLELIRQFAYGQLVDAGEVVAIRATHFHWCLQLAERAAQQLSGPEQAAALNRLEREHPNLRMALEFSRVHDPSAGLRLVGALWEFWEIRGHFAEGRMWSEDLLAKATEPKDDVAQAMLAAGALAARQGDYPGARPMLEKSLELFGTVGDRWGIAWTLDNLGALAMADGDIAAARARFDEGLRLFRHVGDRRGVACVLDNLGWAALLEGRPAEAEQHFEHALAVFREIGDQRGCGRALGNLANLARMRGDRRQARALVDESLQLCQVRPRGPGRRDLSSLPRSLASRLRLAGVPGVLAPLTVPCAGVCAAYPLIAAGISITPGVFAALTVVHFVLLPVLLIANAGLLLAGFLRHRHPFGLAAGAMGAVLIFAALTEHVLDYPWVGHQNYLLHALVYPGALLLLAGAVIDWRARRRVAA